MSFYVSKVVNLYLTEDGKIVGIEILDVSKNFLLQSLFTCEFDSKLIAPDPDCALTMHILPLKSGLKGVKMRFFGMIPL